MKSFGISKRNQFYQIFVAFFILREKNQMICCLTFAFGIPIISVISEVYFATKYRLDAFFLSRFVEIQYSKQSAMVCYCNRWRASLTCPAYHIANSACAIQKTVLAMIM